jgi:hypothetical protein
MIESAGVLRLGEAVRLAPGWDALTVDDFTWRTRPRAAGPGIEDDWLVFIDGRPVEAGAFGTTSLEHLPIDLASIDSIVFTGAPDIVAGAFARGGHLHIHTRRPGQDGLSARARLGFGSETGDPGPFVFLPGGRTNRDRYGHESAAEASVRRSDWYATASWMASVHLPTDPLILPRVQAAASSSPRIERIAPSLRLGRNGSAGGHHLIAGVSRLDDWFRLDLAGIEVPSRATFSHLSAAGAFPLRGFDLAYRAGFDRARVDSRPEAVAPPLDVTWRTARGNLEARTRSGSRRFGITFDHRDVAVDAAYPLGDASDLGAYLTLDAAPSPGFSQDFGAILTGHRNGLEGGVVVRNALETGNGRLLLSLSGARGRALGPRGLVDFLVRDDRWLEATGLTVALPPGDAATWEAGAELGWRREAGRGTLSASLFFRAMGDVLVAIRDLAWDPVLEAWRGPVAVEAVPGRMIGGSVGARLRLSPELDVAADWHVASPAGDPGFRDAAAAVPVHRALATARWRPVAGFGLGATLEVESGRRWLDHEAAQDPVAKARTAVPGRATLSLAAWKTFLGGRLRGQAVARNLAGESVILHPEGSGGGLAFLFLLGGAL